MSATLESGSAAAPLRTCVGDQTMAGVLVDEIERVAVARERHRRLGEDVGNIEGFAPALALMTFSLDAAKRAIGANDLVAMIVAYHELRGYEDG